MYCTYCGEKISSNSEICTKCGVPQYKIKNYCYNCGHRISEIQEVCVNCGVSVNYKSKKKKSYLDYKYEPWLICLLSCLVLGLGQFILGQTKKGVLLLLGGGIISLITCGIATIIMVPISGIDGYITANKIKNGEEIEDMHFF